MECDIHQPAIAIRAHAWHTSDRCGIEYAIPHQAKPARPFRDQHRPIGKERDAPRVGQALREHADPYLSLFGGIEHERSVTEWRHRNADLLLCVAGGDQADDHDGDDASRREACHESFH